MSNAGLPHEQGLYNPSKEHDNCGVGFVAHIKGKATHDIVLKGLEILVNLTHRGATGADPTTGDGAGIMTQIPHKFFKKECAKIGINLPEAGKYAIGVVFLPDVATERDMVISLFEKIVEQEGQKVLGWRDVPYHPEHCGEMARTTLPIMKQIFIENKTGSKDPLVFERKLFVIRKQLGFKVRAAKLSQISYFHVASLSSRTIIYKGQLMAEQMTPFYPDLSDKDFDSALALVHQRYSTNTFPSWDLAHPFRYLAHNGEINTLHGNVNWLFCRESLFSSALFGDDVKKLLPIIRPNSSDSFAFDNALELLYLSGRSLPEAMMMLVPEAWETDTQMEPARKSFYAYYANKMEPWDGPAALAFTDGVVIGATLDRNGLRPAKYIVTKDDLVVMASESGVLPIPEKDIVRKWRLQPGKILVVDTVEGRIIDDSEVKKNICESKPYAKWLADNQLNLDNLPSTAAINQPDSANLLRNQQIFGYTEEELRVVLGPMALTGYEPIASMGTDTPIALLSSKPQSLFNYFKQLFAQVTNPPIDPIREELVMSLTSYLGSKSNILEDLPADAARIKLKQPILTNLELEKIRKNNLNQFKATTIKTLYTPNTGEAGLRRAIDALCKAATQAVKTGSSILIISDRGVDGNNIAIPSLLALGAVHHHLIREGIRGQTSIVVESAEPREVHHFALLIGFGAAGINPYLAFETITDLYTHDYFPGEFEEKQAHYNFIKAIDKGLLKIFSKMGISTLQSYQGAQIFEAIGLNSEVTDSCFTGTPSRVGGVGFDIIAQENELRYREAFTTIDGVNPHLGIGGQYSWRREGELHMYNPDTIAKLQESTRLNNYKTFQEYSKLLDDQSRNLYTIRGVLDFKSDGLKPVSIDEVESAAEIVKRFATGAMSFGSISPEAHENLAIAMNQIGGRSNTGEGGEDAKRFAPEADGTLKRSAIKQVASGRFGVTSHYLVNADEIQIKMAQGAKPGEGGQLPGHKVDDTIARLRHSTPGVGLISPPPHHDIYSIEDLAQLIHDLKNSNSAADISVKLVSEVGVGTVAAGVAKAKADKVTISGYDGGTGASPISSIRHAGTPWELGLAEAQQTLVLNQLRGRVRVQVDGQIKTGRDVAIAALIGADEVGFATAPLIVSGCIMMRKCHLNTCPVGIATQDPVLRAKFNGKPEYIINFFFFIAEEVRTIMAQLGFKKFEDMVGRSDLLKLRDGISHWKAKHIDLSTILYRPELVKTTAIHHNCSEKQDHGINKALDHQLIAKAKAAIEDAKKVEFDMPVRNVNRTVGTMLGGEVSKRYGANGLPDDTITIHFKGTAGQSFGAFIPKGVTLTLEGDGNDYVGKGLSGGKIIIRPAKEAPFSPENNLIVGNTVLYGATSGEVYFNGIAGERFAVRNSGATAVVEGVGDHGCEYMTGGRVVVIGLTGRNFAAGMSGGIAYVFDEDQKFEYRCNMEMVSLETCSDAKEENFVKGLIEKHFALTQSPKAKNILENWNSLKSKFVKVIPNEYRKVLAKLEKERVSTNG